MLARGMRVAHQREPADELAAFELGDEERRVGVALERADVAALVARAAPARIGEQPALLLGGDRRRELDERRASPGTAFRTRNAQLTSTPAPPRRGSPAAASVPSGSTRPPRRRRRRGSGAASGRGRSRARRAGRARPGRGRPRSGRAARRRGSAGRPIASSTPSPCWSTLTTICMIAPRSRAEPALPTTSRGLPSGASAIVGAIMLVSRGPGPRRPAADEVVLAEHVVQVDAGAGDDHARAGAGRGRERGGVAVAVDHRDVRRPAGRSRLGARPARLLLDPALRRRGGTPARAAAPARPPRWRSRVKPPASRAALLAHHLGERRDRLGASRRFRRAAGRAARGRRRSGHRPRTAAGSRAPRGRRTGHERAGARRRR